MSFILGPHEADVVMRAILGSPHFSGWRGFIEGTWLFLESPHVDITMEDMRQLQGWHTDKVGVVLRVTPSVSVYLRCQLLGP